MKKIISIIIISLIIIFFIFDISLFRSNYGKQNRFFLENRVKYWGDKRAYEELRIMNIANYYQENLYYSKLMVDKYHNTEYCYDIFLALFCRQQIDVREDGIFTLDKLSNEEKNEALCYLKKGADIKNYESMRQYGNYLMKGVYFTKDTVLGSKLINEAREILHLDLQQYRETHNKTKEYPR